MRNQPPYTQSITAERNSAIHLFELMYNNVNNEGQPPYNVAGLATVVSGASMMDHISYLLDKTRSISGENNTLVSCLLRRVLEMCGVTLKVNESITRQFIHYVFSLLHLTMSRFVNAALITSNSLGL